MSLQTTTALHKCPPPPPIGHAQYFSRCNNSPPNDTHQRLMLDERSIATEILFLVRSCACATQIAIESELYE